MDSISSFFLYFDICNHICLDTSYHFSALSLLLKYYSLFFSSTPVLTFSIDVVFILSTDLYLSFLFLVRLKPSNRNRFKKKKIHLQPTPISIEFDHSILCNFCKCTKIRLGPFSVSCSSKLRLCSANHRPGYWSNLSCDWPSTAWAYSEQETENGPRNVQSKLDGLWVHPWELTPCIIFYNNLVASHHQIADDDPVFWDIQTHIINIYIISCYSALLISHGHFSPNNSQ